jgi:hypothetical protein
MATYTSNYGWTKPSGSDNVDISVLNDNLDDQDSTIHDAFLNMAPPFSESSTYAVDDIVLYTTGLYKCHTAVVTPGSWTGSTNWQVYKLSEGGSGGGGTSNYNDLTNKPSINGVTLSGNKTTSDLGITASGVGAIPSTDKGTNGGVAELDANGKVPSSQLPSYVDDVLSYSSQSAFPATGETGKIYIAEDTNKTYRWSGSAYAEISASLALGETSSTAYRGDRGKTAYDHSQTTGNPHGTTASDVGLGNVPNVSTNDQTPTFTEASTRNNIASGEKLSVIFGKIQKFFNDLKTVAFSGSYTDLTNTPTIPPAQVNSDWNASSGVAEILNKPSSYTPSSHKHGNIQNGGTLQTTDVAIANGDKLVVTDSSNSAKIARTSATFDGTTTTQALSKKGTFETFSKFSGSYTDLTNKPSLATVATSGSYADLTNQPQINGNMLTGNKTTSDLGINADNVMMSDGVTSVEDAFNNLNGFLNPVGFNVTLNTNKVKFADGTNGNDGANICLKFPSLKIALMSVSLNISSTLSDTDISVPFVLPKNVRVNFNAQGSITNLPYINLEGQLIGAGYFPTGQVKIFAIFRYSNT